MFFKKTIEDLKEFTESSGPTIGEWVSGSVFRSGKVMNLVPAFLLIVLLIFIYIANGYSCNNDIVEMDALQKRLVDVKQDALTYSSELMYASRQSHVKRIIESHGVKITESVTPPYRIKKQ